MYSPNTNATPVIFNHSAAIDDFVATALLLTMPNINLQGVIVTNADCIAEPAMKTTYMVHKFFEIDNIPLSLSNARGWNSFPYLYRKDCITMGTIDLLKPFLDLPPVYDTGDYLIVDLLTKAVNNQQPVTILATGPITAITNVVLADKSLLAGIDKIIWMGGAIDKPGNLDPTVIPKEIANTHAEWNAFWDPAATSAMFEMFSGVNVFPLDITDQAKITADFMSQLGAQQQYPFSQFVYQAYQLVADEPFYEMWNTCAASYLSGMNIGFQEPELSVVNVVTSGFEQGWIQRAINVQGKLQNLFLNIQSPAAFYNYILTQLRK